MTLRLLKHNLSPFSTYYLMWSRLKMVLKFEAFVSYQFGSYHWRCDLVQVEVLVVLQNEHSFSWRSAPEVDTMVYEYSPSNKELADHLHKCAPLYSNSSIARHSLTSVIEHPPRREPLSESLLKQSSLGTSLHTQLDHAEECSLGQKLQKPIDDDRYDDVDDSSSCQDSTVSIAPTILVLHLGNSYEQMGMLFVALHNRLFLTAKRALQQKDRAWFSEWRGKHGDWRIKSEKDS